jgi:hypothetical protein
VDRAVAALAVAVVLVSFGGAPDLVAIGRVTMCVVFAGFSLKTVPYGFSCLVFLINWTRVLRLYRFSASFPYKLVKFPSS